MTQAMATLMVFVLVLGLLCLPPGLALRGMTRRLPWVAPQHVFAYRLALVAAGVTLLYNLAVAMVLPPRIASGLSLTEAMGVSHLIGFALAWIWLWVAVAMSVLMRRRRRLTV